MAVVRKVKSRVVLPAKKEEPQKKLGRETENPKTEVKSSRSRRVCLFCKTKTEPAYWDAVTLRKCLNDRGRIIPKSRTGACAKHQRRISREIKRARFLALLPYTVMA